MLQVPGVEETRSWALLHGSGGVTGKTPCVIVKTGAWQTQRGSARLLHGHFCVDDGGVVMDFSRSRAAKGRLAGCV